MVKEEGESIDKRKDITDSNYKPEDDPDVTDDLSEELDRVREMAMPYHRYIMIIGTITLIFLLVFLGYAYGGLKICSDLDGLLDDKFKCHPGFFKQGEGSLLNFKGSPVIMVNDSYKPILEK